MYPIPLTRLEPGQEATVAGVTGKLSSARRLLELGLISGTPVQYVRHAPFGDPIVLDIAGARFSLRRELAALISVVPATAP